MAKRAGDGSSRGCRRGRLDLLLKFGRVGHPEMLDDLADGDPVHVDRRQRDALPRGRHPVERPGVGALETADGNDLDAFRYDVVVHVAAVRERGVELRETAEKPGPIESGDAGRAAHELGVEEVALDLQVAFSIEAQHDRLVAFDGGRLPHLDVGLHEPATMGAGFGVLLTRTFDSGNRYPVCRLRRDPWMRKTSGSSSPSMKTHGRATAPSDGAFPCPPRRCATGSIGSRAAGSSKGTWSPSIRASSIATNSSCSSRGNGPAKERGRPWQSSTSHGSPGSSTAACPC